MAQAAVAPGLESLAGMDAHADTLTKLEKTGRANRCRACRGANRTGSSPRDQELAQGDIARAGQLALEATQEDGSNGQAFTYSPWLWSVWGICTRRL